MPTKVRLVKAMVFPVVMYGCESWTIKKAERRRIDASELWCWRRLLRVPWTARGSNQSILKEISPECLLEGTNVEAEAPILWPLDAKSWLIGKDSDAGKHWRQEEKGLIEDEMVGRGHWLNGHGFGWTPGVGDGQEGLVCCASWGCRVGRDWATELNWISGFYYSAFLVCSFHVTQFEDGYCSLQKCFLITLPLFISALILISFLETCVFLLG